MITKPEPTYCKNCENVIRGNHCNNCGQRTSIDKVTFKETFQDFVDTIFSVDAPLWTTMGLLITNPGKLFREYLAGKRKVYYKPVAFFILTTIVFFSFKSLLNYNPLANNSVTEKENVTMYLMQQAGGFMFRNIDKILFLFVFTLATSLKLFFYKKNTLAEYVAISFYLLGIYSLFSVLNMFIIKYTNQSFKFISMSLMLIYVIYALQSFFKENKLLVIVKATFAYIIALIFYIILGFGLSFLIVWLKAS